MAYDVQKGGIYLFGGYDSAFERRGDTWLYDGSSWTEIGSDDATGVLAPSPRERHSMVNLATHGGLMLFGGMVESNVYDGQTWLLDDNNVDGPASGWTQIFNGQNKRFQCPNFVKSELQNISID